MSLDVASQAHSAVSDGLDGEYKCNYCRATFPDKKALKAHKIQANDDETRRKDQHITHLYCEYCDLDIKCGAAASDHWAQVSSIQFHTPTYIIHVTIFASPPAKTDIPTVPC